jgi:hypothetical protein
MTNTKWPAKRPTRSRTTYSLATVLALLLLAWATDWVREWNIRRENRSELAEIAKVEPQSAIIFQNFIAEIESKTPWKVSINSGLRSEEEQAELKKKNPKNASSERSKHVKGKAMDINLYQKQWLGREWLRKSDTKSRWQKTGIVQLAKQYGLKWGGDFKTYHDPVHFEVID